MQIVIDIPDERYKDIQRIAEVQLGLARFQTAEQIIAKGTPLPKGHGRLIDADELYKQDKEEWLCPNNAPFISTDYAHVFAEIDHAPTIIEADKAGEEV